MIRIGRDISRLGRFGLQVLTVAEPMEVIHVSVRERWSSSRKRRLTSGPAIWTPKALEGFSPRKKDGSEEWEWVKNGTMLTIPEAPFPTAEERFERQLRYGEEVSWGSVTKTEGSDWKEWWCMVRTWIRRYSGIQFLSGVFIEHLHRHKWS
jgi:hypothetical protein